jgi:hypothetical protein
MEIIHIVLGKANPERMNGVNKVVFQLATKQAESGRNVSVWGITKDPVKNFPERAFSTLLFPLGKHHFALDSTLKAAIKAHADKAVFHIHGSWVSTFWAVASTLKKYSAQICCHTTWWIQYDCHAKECFGLKRCISNYLKKMSFALHIKYIVSDKARPWDWQRYLIIIRVFFFLMVSSHNHRLWQ